MAKTTYPTAHTTTVQNPRMRLLNKLREGSYPLMTFMAIPSVRMAQIVALTGLDVSKCSSLTTRPAP
jgi:4-hydroxy-2-oxoheptanedioate aldolase